MVHVGKLEGFCTGKKGVTDLLFPETLLTPLYPFAFAAIGLLCLQLISKMDQCLKTLI